MGHFILCREAPAEHPLYIEELDINIYTGEELSYYIYNNLVLIMGEDFINDKLLRFIAEELKKPTLALKLQRWAKNSSQGELLLVILQDLRYYRSEELVDFSERVSRVANASTAERVKQRADNLFGKRRFYEAIALYDRLLPPNGVEPEDPDFTGRIWYNRGSALCGLFSFDQAVESYTTAYQLLGDEDILKQIYMVGKVDGLVRLPDDLLGRVPELTVEKWKDEFDEAASQISYEGRALDVACLKEKDKIRRAAGLQNLVLGWKKEYRRSLG